MSYCNKSYSSIILFEQLGLENPFKVYANSGLDQQIQKHEWIMHGKTYGNALELLEFQLALVVVLRIEVLQDSPDKGCACGERGIAHVLGAACQCSGIRRHV